MVEYLAEGTWHKVYTVTTTSSKTNEFTCYVFRVALPVDPYYKTDSEVATTELVRHSTNIPVPAIYAYDSSTKNKLGLEWMLMERVVGKPLTELWPDMSDDSTLLVTKRVVDWAKQLSTIMRDKVGGIYMRYTEKSIEFYVGRCVHQLLHRDSRLSYNVNRGPFESLHDFYDTTLALIEYETNDLKGRLALEIVAGLNEPLDLAPHSTLQVTANGVSQHLTAEERLYARADKDDEDDFRRWLQVDPDYPRSTLRDLVVKLRSNLQDLCGSAGDSSGKLETLLAHKDVSSDNIFLDETGTPVALLDWENIQLEPPVLLCQFPEYLLSNDMSYVPQRIEKPDPSRFDTIEEAEECYKDQEE